MKKERKKFFKSEGLVGYSIGMLIMGCLVCIPVGIVILVFSFREHGNIPIEGIIFAIVVISLIPLIFCIILISTYKHFFGRIIFSETGIEWSCLKKRVKFFTWEDIVDWNTGGFRVRGEYTIDIISKDNDSFRFTINSNSKKLMIDLCSNEKFIEWLKDYKVGKELRNKNPNTTQDNNS